MLSEIHASHTATTLERVLEAALSSENPDVIKFVEAHIVPLYEDNVGESWGCHKTPERIIKAFPNYYNKS